MTKHKTQHKRTPKKSLASKSDIHTSTYTPGAADLLGEPQTRQSLDSDENIEIGAPVDEKKWGRSDKGSLFFEEDKTRKPQRVGDDPAEFHASKMTSNPEVHTQRHD